MPKPDTMLQRTSRVTFVSIAVLCFVGLVLAQSTSAPPPAQNNQTQNQTQQAPTKPGQPLSPAELEGPPTQAAPPATGQAPAQQGTQQQPQAQQPAAPGGQLSPGELEGPPTQAPASPNPQQPAAQGQGTEIQKGEGD